MKKIISNTLKITINSLMLVLLLGFVALPATSMGLFSFVGGEPAEVLSVQDERLPIPQTINNTKAKFVIQAPEETIILTQESSESEETLDALDILSE